MAGTASFTKVVYLWDHVRQSVYKEQNIHRKSEESAGDGGQNRLKGGQAKPFSKQVLWIPSVQRIPSSAHSVIVSGSGSGQSYGEGAHFQSKLLEKLKGPSLPPTERNLGGRDFSCISLLQTVDQRVGFQQGHSQTCCWRCLDCLVATEHE